MSENKGNQITGIGQVNFRNDERIFGIYQNDRLGHIYTIGRTGSGKSTLLLNMAISDIKNNNGFCLIDPHGDLAESIIDQIPANRVEDVLYFNPSDTEFPISFNPIRNVHPNFQHLVASGIISTFKKLYSDSWGPRMEHILRFTLLTLLESRNASLLDIQKMLINDTYRYDVLSKIKDSNLLSFWDNEFNKYSKQMRAEVISPILNKVGIFSSNSMVRNIFGQKTRSFHFQKVMDEGKILICNLSKGRIGNDMSSLFGSLIVTQIQLASLYRARIPEEERRFFALYIDECQSFISESISDILSESRKYGLSLFLTHQYTEQLPEKIISSILGNVGTLIAFRLGSIDAIKLATEFQPIFNETDLINIPKFCMILKLQIMGATSQPFTAKSLPIERNLTSYRIKIIEYSRAKYGRPKSYVEEEAEIAIKTNDNYLQSRLFE